MGRDTKEYSKSRHIDTYFQNEISEFNPCEMEKLLETQKPGVSALKAKKQVSLQNSFWAGDGHCCRPSPLGDVHGHGTGAARPFPAQAGTARDPAGSAQIHPQTPFSLQYQTFVTLTQELKPNTRGEKTEKKTTQAVVLTSSSWEGQVEKANFVLLVDSIYNPPFSMESALKWYCCAVLARDCTCWPLHGQQSTRIISYKRFALNVMKQMTKSINLEWCGYHKNDVNSEFTLVMKLFRFIIKTSTISFFRIKLPFDNHRWMLQEIFNKCIQN